MAADIPEITESNHEDPSWIFANQPVIEHVLIDLQEALKMLRDQGRLLAKHDALLEEFRPLLDQFRSPAAAYVTRRAQRRNGNG